MAVERFHQFPVCLKDTTVVDLDGDGVATDILVRYVEKDNSTDCKHVDSPVVHAIILQGRGLSLRQLQAFNGIAGGTALFNTYVVGPLIFREIVSGTSFPETGAQIHVPDGYFQIDFDLLSKTFKQRQLDWDEIIGADGHGLVLRIDDDDDDPKFFANDEPLQVESGHHASIMANLLDRLYLDPRCVVEGLKPAKDNLGVYTLGVQAKERKITCVTHSTTTYIDVSVKSTDNPFK
jgi:hypothetical protein